jgi:ABC-2 type transport system permease protein
MLDKILAVGRAEYLQAVRSKAFLIGLLLMPLMFGGSLLAQIFLEDQVDLTARTCAVVDPTGELWHVIEEQARLRNEEQIWEDAEDGKREQKRPHIEFVRHVPDGSDAETELELSERVRNGELDGFLLLRLSVLAPDADVGDRPAAYHTDSPTFTELPRWLDTVLNTELRRVRFAAADLDEELIAQLDQPVSVGSWGLASLDRSGEVKAGQRENKGRTFGVPAGAMFLLFMLVMSSAPALMNQVLEEKMLRISEVLVSAVSPFQLMMGKLLGSVLVSLTLGFLYLGCVAGATHYYGVGDFVPWSLYAWFLLMLVLALLMYGSVLSALGSACSELRDAQSMIVPAMIVVMIPLMAWSAVIESPNGTVATALTFLPTATPLVLMLRLGVSPGPPAWEVAASVTLCLAATVFFVWASSRVFRIGVLSQGQTPSLKVMASWVFSKD